MIFRHSFLTSMILTAATANVPGAASAQTVPTPNPVIADTLTITLAGDTGFSPNAAPVSAKGVTRHGRFQTWADTTKGIASLVDGDLNFLNVETVVTENNGLTRDTKSQGGPFNFRTHPAGMLHLVETGFNVFSLANNHSMDYGVGGLKDTLKYTGDLKAQGLLAAAGLGMNRAEASAPDVIRIKGSRVAFSSIGIVTNNLGRHRAGENSPGQIAYRFDDDFDLVTKRLAETPSDYRMLSIHYGIEGQVRTDSRQINDYRKKAAIADGIDLIVGHHAHVPRGVEIAGRSIIFYGLGNFLHHGTANMSSKGICKDYGLFARVHLRRQADGHLAPRAIEAIPLTGMHDGPEPMSASSGTARIHALNYLGSTLGSNDGSAIGAQFTPQADGSGLYCFPGAADDPGRVGRLCKSWQPAPGIPGNLRSKIAGSCSR